MIGDHRLRPDQIAIIGPTSLKNGVFGKWSEISGIPLTESARDWRAQKGLLCTTARSFKGLEADVVILYDLNGVGLQFTESDLYVALTRARSHLVIVASQNGFSEALQGAAARTSA